MKPKLSFCIPTRNRARFIAECLDSIFCQATSDIEIVVVDGASTDNTREVVLKYSAAFPGLVYFRRDECVGVDRDVLKAVELAGGEYCWLMSDDDRLELGALGYVLNQIATYSFLTGISVNIAAYDSQMNYQIHAVPSASGGRMKADHFFTDRDQCFSILGVHFGFLSGQIINRGMWCAVVSNSVLDEFCNSWLLVYIIGRMLEYEPRWLYIHARLVAYRSGNDSFAARLGVCKRQEITHVAYEKIVRQLFGYRSKVYDQVLYIILSDRMARSLAVIKADGCPLSTQFKLLLLYLKQYSRFPLFWVKVLPIFFIPNTLLKYVRKIYFFARSRGYNAVSRDS